MAITKQKLWTYEDYYNLNDDKRYEVVEGELIEMPAPRTIHQRISSNLGYELISYVRPRKLGSVLDAPCDVILSDINTLQPDLLFISKENRNIIQERGVFGTPDLVIEILSPSNPDHDRVKKFSIYEKFRLKELWIIDADKKSVEVFVLESDKLVSFCDARETMKIKSQTFTELDLCFDDLVKV